MDDHPVPHSSASAPPINSSVHSAVGSPTGTTPPTVNICDCTPKKQHNRISCPLRKPTRPSLTKIVLSLQTLSSQHQALQQILNALQIINAREAIVSALLAGTASTFTEKGIQKLHINARSLLILKECSIIISFWVMFYFRNSNFPWYQ